MIAPLQTLAFSLGGPEVAVIFLVVLLLFGAKKIPQLARGLGKSMGEFKKARTEFEDEIKRAGDAVNEEDDDEKAKKMAESEVAGQEETDPHA